MIQEVEMFIIYCDNCEMPQEDADGNATAYFDKEEADEGLKSIEEDGWTIVGKKCYCPQCAINLNLL